jgi:hypothetical protein
LAQVHGDVSVTFDVLPDVSDAPGRQAVSELRTRLFVERRGQVGEHLRFTLSGYADGLLADRESLGFSSPSTAAIARPMDLFAEFVSSRVNLRAGFSRVVWGRLDEFQPTDVLNPLDLTRFLLDGRTEARLPVPLVSTRVVLHGETAIEAIAVPAFRPGRFDQLDERSSPFNVGVPPRLVVRREKPETLAGNLQGGVRLTSTVRRVDWGLSAYRGLRSFPTLSAPTLASPYVETFPRFTMLGGDFETVHGEWGIRGEAAAFVDDALQLVSPGEGGPRLSMEDGHSMTAGVGVDRRAGDYRIAGDVLWSYRAAGQASDSDMTLVAAADRSFVRDTRMVRVLAVYDPGDAFFVRAIVTVSVRDDIAIEGSSGLFTADAAMSNRVGLAVDTLARFARRDFLYARLKVLF